MSHALDWNAFADAWCAAWNAHDVERVLAHFHDDAVFTSPGAARIVPASGGTVRGKDALRAYWTEALRRIPDLHFAVEQVFAGIDTLVIQYRNQKGVSVSEVLVFEDGRVRAGHGTYPIGVDNPVGAAAG
ncbi:nuclear transport factor 2 family protein [Methylobacterium sp. A52T]